MDSNQWWMHTAGAAALAALIGCAGGGEPAGSGDNGGGEAIANENGNDSDNGGGEAAAAEAKAPSQWDRPGFVTHEEDGRIWVFAEGAKELEQFETRGELAKHVTLIAAGPERRTLKAPDRDTALAYLATRSGFVTFVEAGRVWVFVEGSKELEQYRGGGELAKHVTRIAVGPLRATIKAPDGATIDAYLAAADH